MGRSNLTASKYSLSETKFEVFGTLSTTDLWGLNLWGSKKIQM
jgi:hypothetical protein